MPGPASRGPELVTRRDVTHGLCLAAAVTMIGAPVGLLWAAVTPRAELRLFDNGNLGLADVEDKAFISQDLAFFGITLLAGLVVGVVAWFVGKRWAVGAIVGAVLGAALAAYVAMRCGQIFDARLGTFEASDRSIADGFPLTLPQPAIGLGSTRHSRMLLLGWPAGAALGFAATAFWRIGPPDPNEALSSGKRFAARSRQ